MRRVRQRVHDKQEPVNVQRAHLGSAWLLVKDVNCEPMGRAGSTRCAMAPMVALVVQLYASTGNDDGDGAWGTEDAECALQSASSHEGSMSSAAVYSSVPSYSASRSSQSRGSSARGDVAGDRSGPSEKSAADSNASSSDK